MKRIFPAIFLLCAFAAPSNLIAQVAPAYAARLQTVLDSMCALHHIRGASTAIYIPGSGIWKGVHGEAQAGVAITPDMIFGLGSNTKTYIAALLLKLQEEGALSLNDTIGKWIAGRRNISGAITIRQLLNHTSGVYSYTDAPACEDSILADYARVWQPAEMLRFVDAPSFAPGMGWEYSNTNFLLAGMIAAQVTGMPVEAALRAKILSPNGLTNTFFYPQETPAGTMPHVWMYDGGSMVDADLVYGYTHQSFLSAASAAGALISTAEDNVRFWQRLMGGSMLGAASMAEWRQTIRLSGNIGYGLGVIRYRSFNGHVAYTHGGTGFGFINENLADSVSGVCISLLTNQDSADNDILLEGVIRALHKVTLDPPMLVVHSGAAPVQITLFPNPAQTALHVSLPSGPASGYSYAIFNSTGRQISGGRFDNGAQSISVEELPAGAYYLRLFQHDGRSGMSTFTVLR